VVTLAIDALNSFLTSKLHFGAETPQQVAARASLTEAQTRIAKTKEKKRYGQAN